METITTDTDHLTGTVEAPDADGRHTLALHSRGVATDQAHRMLISGNQKDIGALLMALLTELTGEPIIGCLDVDDLVCALHTLAEQQQSTSQEDLSSRQRAVIGKVCDGWDEDLAASLCEQCNDRPPPTCS